MRYLIKAFQRTPAFIFVGIILSAILWLLAANVPRQAIAVSIVEIKPVVVMIDPTGSAMHPALRKPYPAQSKLTMLITSDLSAAIDLIENGIGKASVLESPSSMCDFFSGQLVRTKKISVAISNLENISLQWMKNPLTGTSWIKTSSRKNSFTTKGVTPEGLGISWYQGNDVIIQSTGNGIRISMHSEGTLVPIGAKEIIIDPKACLRQLTGDIRAIEEVIAYQTDSITKD